MAGKGDHSGDTYVDDQITKAQREVDADKRRALVHDLQRVGNRPSLGSVMFFQCY